MIMLSFSALLFIFLSLLQQNVLYIKISTRGNRALLNKVRNLCLMAMSVEAITDLSCCGDNFVDLSPNETII